MSCNRACEDIFGYAEGELVGRRVADIIARAAPSDEATLSLDGLFSTRKGEISEDLTVYVDFVQGAHENISPLVAASVLGPARSADIVMHTMDGQRVPESPMREFDEQDLPALFTKNQNNNINVSNSNNNNDDDDDNNNNNNNKIQTIALTLLSNAADSLCHSTPLQRATPTKKLSTQPFIDIAHSLQKIFQEI